MNRRSLLRAVASLPLLAFLRPKSDGVPPREWKNFLATYKPKVLTQEQVSDFVNLTVKEHQRHKWTDI